VFDLLSWALTTPRLGECSVCCPKFNTQSPSEYTSVQRHFYMSPPLNFVGTLQLSYWARKLNLPHLSEIHSWLLLLLLNIIIINFLRKVLKVKISSPLYHWVLTKSFPLSFLLVSYQYVGPIAGLTNSWAGQVPAGSSVIVGCLWVGPRRHWPMAEQALLPRNRMQSNTAQQWLPAKGCALLQKDTLCPVAGIFLIDSFPTSDLISHN